MSSVYAKFEFFFFFLFFLCHISFFVLFPLSLMTGRPVPDEGFQWTKYSLGEMKRKIEKNTFLSVCLHNSLAHVTHAVAYAH